MRVAVLISSLLVASCGPSNDTVDAADFNARDALDQISSLRSRVDELESQVSDLETQVHNEASTRESEDAGLDDQIQNHTHY